MAERPRFKEPDPARRDARSYLRGLVWASARASRSLLHDDKMLTWLAGLMGAGLLALPTVLEAACPVKPPRFALVAGPWAVGILCATAGRLVSAWHRDADQLFATAKVSTMRKMLIDDVSELDFARRYAQIFEDSDPRLKKQLDLVTRYRRIAGWVFYATMAAFAIGVLAIYLRLALC